MKLEEAARKAIELLKEAGENGINNVELAQKLKVPKRRVYDIVNPLKPAGLIEVRKEKGKTKAITS
ncbi:MAG: helix-turn-helix domain-containing protein [Candidatus Jordarchaeaceae archaeon]